MEYVRYTKEIETLQENERETLDELGSIFRGIQEHVLKKSGSAKRGTHAKATGLLKGHFVIDGDLPAELAQGLFATPRRYDALIRFAQGPSENLPDAASGQRGLSVKVLGVEGHHVAGSRETTTQDWVLATHDAAFTDGTAQAFLATFRPVAAKSTFVPAQVIVTGSRLARGAEAVLEAVGSGSAHLRFFGKKPTHPASDSYFSQAAVRYGDYVAKVSAVPTAATLAAIGDADIDTSDDDAFRIAMVAFFAARGAEFEIRVQLCIDLEAMPVEDAAVVWPAEQSPYRTVGRLLLPAQDAYNEERRAYFDERLAFNPIHALEEHRPLGSIMRARAHVYLQTQDFRQRSNGAEPAEPWSSAEVPG